MLVDQLIATPLLHVPGIQLAFLFRKCGRSPARFAATVRARRMFSRHALLAEWWMPALFPTWLIWAPTVCVVYALPAALQIPLFAIVLVFWSIVQMVLSDEDEGKKEGGGEGEGGETSAAATTAAERGDAVEGAELGQGTTTQQTKALELADTEQRT